MEQQRLGIGESAVERGIHSLLDEALWLLMPVPDGKNRRLAQRIMEVAQRDSVEIGSDRPASRMAPDRGDYPGIAQKPHCPANGDGVRIHAFR